MQSLVYLFIVLAAVSVGGLAYFGLTFTVIEAFLAAIATFLFATVALERTLRTRAEVRMEKAIDDLSRLLSTDAQAGQVLNQRINAMAKIDAGNRLEVLEADISVLGTVMRQVAEAVSDIERKKEQGSDFADRGPVATTTAKAPESKEGIETYFSEPEPVIPLEMVRQALEENRLAFHMQPIITLPQRRTHGYDILPRLMLEDGEIADSEDFMPTKGGNDIVAQIERMGIEETVTIVRRAQSVGQPTVLFAPLSKITLGDRASVERLIGLFDANRVVAANIVLRITDADWRALTREQRAVVDEFAAKGIKFSIINAKSLRVDFANLAALGVTSIRISATQFIDDSQSMTDFHTSDVADYTGRFGVDLMAEDIRHEQQVLTVLEDGIKYAQGPHIAGPSPIRADLLVTRNDRSATAPQQLRGI